MMNAHFEFHRDTSCNYAYSYQIIEKLPGTGYSNGREDAAMSKIRKDKEDG